MLTRFFPCPQCATSIDTSGDDGDILTCPGCKADLMVVNDADVSGDPPEYIDASYLLEIPW